MWVSALLAGLAPARAQWVQQQFSIVPGWNSVYLEVDPSPSESDALWAGLPITAVWSRSEPAGTAPATSCTNPDDPACAPTDDTGWRVWVPASGAQAVVNSLALVTGGRVYLIRATSAFTWSVAGRPSSAATTWIAGANLVGFHVVSAAASTPTFAQYLSPFLSVSSGSVFEVRSDGALQGVNTPAATRITPGRGYWVKSPRAGSYDGPIGVDRASLRGVDFGKRLVEHALTITNLASSSRDVAVEAGPSAPVPQAPAGLPTLVGEVPLLWFDYDTGPTAPLEWRELTTQAFGLSAAGQSASRRTIRVAVDRFGLPPASLDEQGRGSLYASILRIRDGAGFERMLPAAAEVAGGSLGQTAGGPMDVAPGLYVGTATVNAVSWVTAGARRWVNEDPVNPVVVPGQPDDTGAARPTASQFRLPLLVHVSSNGTHRMLHEVVTMWQPEAPPDRPTGRFVLMTPACPPAVRATLVAGSVRDGEPFARRLSTAAFFFADAQGRDTDLVMSGSLLSSMTGTAILRDNHRVNPFRHLYHPDHDCNEAGECFDIVRVMTLTPDMEAEFRPGLGESVFSGTYQETITGLYRGAIQVRGTFELTRVSQIAGLNGE